MRNTVLGGISAGLLLLPSIAMAQSGTGFYVEGRGGVTVPRSTDLDGGAGVKFEVDYDTGFNFAAAAGYADSIGFRGELEVAYQQSDTDQITITNDGGFGVANGLGSLNGLGLNLEGDVSALTALVNVYYDIDTGGPLTPYIGAGVGIAQVNVDVSTLGVKLVDDSDTVLAYQVGAGVAYAINQNLSATLAYRYLGTSDAQLTDTAGASGDWGYASHNFVAGLRYTF